MSDYLRTYGLGPTRLLCSWDSAGKNTVIGCHALLKGIFPTQGLNSYLLYLLHWQADSLPLAPPVLPLYIMEFGLPIFCSCFCIYVQGKNWHIISPTQNVLLKCYLLLHNNLHPCLIGALVSILQKKRNNRIFLEQISLQGIGSYKYEGGSKFPQSTVCKPETLATQ